MSVEEIRAMRFFAKDAHGQNESEVYGIGQVTRLTSMLAI